MKKKFAVLALLIIGGLGSYTNAADHKRVIARFPVQADIQRQAKLVVKKLSQLIKQNPKATSYGISFEINNDTYKVVSYNRQARRLSYTTVSTSNGPITSWVNNVFPAHIHKAAQNNLDVYSLWNNLNAKEQP